MASIIISHLFLYSLLILSSYPNSVSATESLYLDLTYKLNEDSVYWPTYENGFQFESVFRNFSGGLYFESNTFSAPEHIGTHMDSPAHLSQEQGKWRAHEVPLDNLIGPAIKVDIKSKADRNSDALLEVADLESWEDTYGRIPDDVILMVYSGWGSRYNDWASYLGTDTMNTSFLHFPGIDPAAAQLMVDRKVKAVGIDTASIDYGQSTEFLAHQILFGQNIPAFENVANLDKLPAIGATVFAFPAKIEDGSGAPVRIVATGWRSDVQNPCDITASAGNQYIPVDGTIMMLILFTMLRQL